MVHMANCGPNTKGAMFFNVDKIVGSGGAPNSSNEDTQLVQWMLRQLGFFGTEGDFYSGSNDAQTIDAITQFQLSNGPFPPDGRVSVALGASYGAQAAPYTIVRLNFAIRDKFRFSGWPHLNQMPNRIMAPQAWRRLAELLGNSSDGG
jgi:Putative peptidoglycan binding domain